MDPRPFSLRELFRMGQARLRHDRMMAYSTAFFSNTSVTLKQSNEFLRCGQLAGYDATENRMEYNPEALKLIVDHKLKGHQNGPPRH